MRDPSEVVFEHLAPYLGPHTARTALRTFCASAVGKGPEMLTLADLPPLLSALRPMMRTLIGAKESDHVLALMRLEFGL